MRKVTLILALLTMLLKANAQTSPLSFYDNFADDSKIEWPNTTTGNERTYKESGRYIIDYRQGERGWAVNKLFPKIQWNEISIELTVNVLEGNSPGIGAGFLIGNVSTPGNSYRFVIQPDGTYGFGYFKDNGVKWIVPFTFSKDIVKGNNADNKLTIKLKDNKALLYINYQLVNTISLPETVTGEEISFYSGKGQRTAFDNMRVDGYSLISDPPGKIDENVVNKGYNNSTLALKKYNSMQEFADFLITEFKNDFPHFRSCMAQNKFWHYQPILIKDQNDLGVKNANVHLNVFTSDVSACIPEGTLQNIDISFFFKNSQEVNKFVAALTKAINLNKSPDRLINMADLGKTMDKEYNYAYGNQETDIRINMLNIGYFENKAARYMGDGWADYTKGVKLRLNNITIKKEIYTYPTANPNDYNNDFSKDLRNLLNIVANDSYNAYIKNEKEFSTSDVYNIYKSNIQSEIFKDIFVWRLDERRSSISYKEYAKGLIEAQLNRYENPGDYMLAEKEFNSYFKKISLTLGNKYYSYEDRRGCEQEAFNMEARLSDKKNVKETEAPKERVIYFYNKANPENTHVELKYREIRDKEGKFRHYVIYCLIK